MEKPQPEFIRSIGAAVIERNLSNKHSLDVFFFYKGKNLNRIPYSLCNIPNY